MFCLLSAGGAVLVEDYSVLYIGGDALFDSNSARSLGGKEKNGLSFDGHLVLVVGISRRRMHILYAHV